MSPGHLHPRHLLRPCEPLARGLGLFRLKSLPCWMRKCSIYHPSSSGRRCIICLIGRTGHCWDSATECSSEKNSIEKFVTKSPVMLVWSSCFRSKSEDDLWWWSPPEGIKSFCMHRDGEGKTMGTGSILRTADVFTVQNQTLLLANHLWAHTFGSLLKWYLDQD